MKFKSIFQILGIMLFSFTVLVNCSFSDAQKLKYEKTLDGASKKAKTENKNVMIFFDSDWCPYCVKLEKEVFNEPDVIENINKYLVPVKMNVDHYQALAMKYKVQGPPSLIFLTPDGEMFQKFGGYAPKNVFNEFFKDTFIGEDSLVKALEIYETDKSNPNVNAKIGLAFIELDNLEKGISLLEPILENKEVIDLKEEILSNLGLAYANSKKHKKAIQCLQQGIEEFPEGERREQNLFNLALVYMFNGEKEKGLSTLDQFEKDYPTSYLQKKIPMIRMQMQQ